MQTHTQLKMFFVGVLSAFAKRTAPTQAIATLLLAVFVQAVLGTQSAHAQTFTVLYNFAGPHIRWDGAYPAGGLVQDAAGNFYGTTSSGGVPTKKCGYCGTVFKLDTAGNETVLHSFGKPGDGAMPQAGLIQDASGNLYGTTQKGGAYNFGTVFKVDTTGKETVLYSFAGGADGEYPLAALVGDGVRLLERDGSSQLRWRRRRGKSHRQFGPGCVGELLRHDRGRRRFEPRDGVQAGYDRQ
jgi:uncharacterized repeat protein (TIGR03803 family)